MSDYDKLVKEMSEFFNAINIYDPTDKDSLKIDGEYYFEDTDCFATDGVIQTYEDKGLISSKVVANISKANYLISSEIDKETGNKQYLLSANKYVFNNDHRGQNIRNDIKFKLILLKLKSINLYKLMF